MTPAVKTHPLTDREIFDSKKQNRSQLDSKIFRNGNAHLYQLVRELTPGNGSIERHTHPTTTFRALSGGGQSGLRLAFLETTFNFHDQGILQVERLAASVQRHTSLNRVGLNSV